MKKLYIYIIISIMIIVTCFGCGKKDEKVKTELSFDLNMAREVGEKYIENLVTGNYELNDKLYSKKLSETNKNIKNVNLKITSYKIEEVIEEGKTGEMKISIANTDLTKPYSSVEELILKIIKEDSKYKIEKIDSSLKKEVFAVGKAIRIKDKDEVKNNLVVDMKGIPNFAIASSDKTKMNKINVPKEHFNSIILTCSGEKMALSSFDKNSFVGILDIDEAKSAESNSGGSGGKGGEGTGGEETEIKPETPLGRNLKSLDMLENSQVEFMGFSEEEEFLIVQYKDSQGENLILYDIESGESIQFDFKKQYKLDKVDVIFKSLGERSIIYEVKSQEGVDVNEPDVRDSIGRWKLDLKNFKAEKVN